MSEEPTSKHHIDPKSKSLTDKAEQQSGIGSDLHEVTWADHKSGHSHTNLRDQIRTNRLNNLSTGIRQSDNKPENED